MEEDLQFMERIDRYLKGELEEAEVAQVEAQMEQDQAFHERVEARRRALRVLGVAGREALRAKFKDLHLEMEAEEPEAAAPSKRRGRWVYWAAAAGIVLLAIPLILWYQNQPSSSPELFASYFQPAQDRLFSGSRSQEDLTFAQAQNRFLEGDYATALPVFQERRQQYPDSMIFQLYVGVALLGMEEGLKAQPILRPLGGQQHPAIQPAAYWYLALSFIPANQTDSTRYYLETLQGEFPGNAFQTQALKLLEEIH